MANPAITVVMSVFNGQEYLEESVKSVLAQTFTDFEFLIIDDGSRDESPVILARLAESDSRIRILTQTNQGIVAALNRGIREAKGKYIARADSDDLCSPDRLKIQHSFMESHPDTVVVCSSYFKLYPDGSTALQVLPANPQELLRSQFRANQIMHASVLMRRSALLEAGAYDERWLHLEDYELWFRMAALGKIVSLPEPLSTLRVHESSVSAQREQYQVRQGLLLRFKLLKQGTVPFSAAHHLVKPMLKSCATPGLLRSYRRLSGKLR